MRLPTYTKKYIAPRYDVSAGAGEQLVAQSLNALSGIATKIVNIQDSTTATAELSDYKLNVSNKIDELKSQFIDNPDEFKKQAGDYIAETSKSLSTNSKVSYFNSSQFNSMLTNTTDGFKSDIDGMYRNIQADKIKADFNKTVANNNILAYRSGLDGDITRFEKEIESSTNNLLIAGQNIYSKNELQAITQNIVQDSYMNYMQGQMVNNPLKAKEMLDSRMFDDKLGVNNLKRLDNATKGLIERDKELIEKGFDNQTIVDGNQNKIRLDSKLEVMDISTGGKKETGTIGNKEFDNLDSIIGFNLELESARKTLTEKEYNTYKSKVYQMIYAKKTKYKGDKFFETNPNSFRSAEIYIADNMSVYDNFDKSQVFIDILTQAKLNNIDLEAKDTESKRAINQISKNVIANYYDIDPTDSNFETKLKDKLQRRNNKLAYDVVNNASINIQKNYDPDNIL